LLRSDHVRPVDLRALRDLLCGSLPQGPNLPSEELLRHDLHAGHNLHAGHDMRSEDLRADHVRSVDLRALHDLLPEALPQGPDLPSEELLRHDLHARDHLHSGHDLHAGHDLRSEDLRALLLDLRALHDLLPEALP